MLCGFMVRTRSGKTWDNGCSTIPVSSGPAVTKRTGAGLRSSIRRHAAGSLSALDVRMAPKHHPTPLSGGDRKALNKELGRARAMTTVLARRSLELRAEAEILIKQAGKLLWESLNERMWADGEPIDHSPTIDQALNGGYPWLQIACSRCKASRDVELASLSHASTTFVHDLASRLRCQKCAKAGRRPSATLEQLAPRTRHLPED